MGSDASLQAALVASLTHNAPRKPYRSALGATPPVPIICETTSLGRLV